MKGLKEIILEKLKISKILFNFEKLNLKNIDFEFVFGNWDTYSTYSGGIIQYWSDKSENYVDIGIFICKNLYNCNICFNSNVIMEKSPIEITKNTPETNSIIARKIYERIYNAYKKYYTQINGIYFYSIDNIKDFIDNIIEDDYKNENINDIIEMFDNVLNFTITNDDIVLF